MFVYRAITSCPVCNTKEEIWFHNSKIVPTSTIECLSCSQVFEASDFISELLNLRSNSTVSAVYLE